MKLIPDIKVIANGHILFCIVTYFHLPVSIERLWFERLNRIKGHQYCFSKSVIYVSNANVCLNNL